jgi:branched-chain amino acid transport system permease protein
MTQAETVLQTRNQRTRPGWILPLGWIVVTVVLVFAPWFGLVNASVMRQIILVALLCLIVSGQNLSFGYAGELSFATPAMYAAGAYATGWITINVINDLAVALVVSAVVGLLLGLISGIPGLRLGGWMLATSSFFLVLLVPNIVDMTQGALGGSTGLPGIPQPKLFGVKQGNIGLYAAVIVITSVWFILYRNLALSRTGRALTVLRQSPVLASSVGISVYGLKLKAYALAALPASMAGTLFAYLDGFIAPEYFGLNYAIAILAAAVLGGKRSIYGVFLGAAIMQLGPMRTTAFGNYAVVAYGLLLIIVGVLLPGGIAGGYQELKSRFNRRTGRETVRRQASRVRKVEFPPLPGKKLTLTGISKTFGGNVALSDVGFEAKPGEVVALIGPNGSGKTTVLNLISGFYRPDKGSIVLGDEDLTGKATHKIAHAGVVRTFQTPIVPEMSVRDAVATARYGRDRASIVETMIRLPRYRRAVRRDEEKARAVLEMTGLADVADADATSLPLGTRRVLELARAIAADPSLVLLDEIASGLDEEEITGLADVVPVIRAAGGTVLLVEHNFALVRELADRVVVLSQGGLVTQGTPDEIASHPEVLRHYLGTPAGAEAEGGDTILDPSEHLTTGDRT